MAGYINTPWFGTFLGDWLTKDVGFKVEETHGPVWIMIVATLVSFAGIALAYFIYRKKSISRNWAGGTETSLYNLLKEKYYVDELYNMTVIPITKGIAHVLRLFEVYVVEGIAVLIASVVKGTSNLGSKLQNGNVQVYGTVTAVSLANHDHFSTLASFFSKALIMLSIFCSSLIGFISLYPTKNKTTLSATIRMALSFNFIPSYPHC